MFKKESKEDLIAGVDRSLSKARTWWMDAKTDKERRDAMEMINSLLDQRLSLMKG